MQHIQLSADVERVRFGDQGVHENRCSNDETGPNGTLVSGRQRAMGGDGSHHRSATAA
jgi:hypothetical protein